MCCAASFPPNLHFLDRHEEFSWPEFLACTLTLAWFWRGLARLPPAEHPPPWRQALFVAGVASFYAVLQTHVDYYAQHLFFVHRWAHFVAAPCRSLRHAAMGTSGEVLYVAEYAGFPEAITIKARPVRATLAVAQHPVVAPCLFVGLLYFWLIPQIHTVVMLSRPLYEFMNWTMAINGVMFWSLVLDSRAKPPARRVAPGARGADPGDRAAADGTGGDPFAVDEGLLSGL